MFSDESFLYPSYSFNQTIWCHSSESIKELCREDPNLNNVRSSSRFNNGIRIQVLGIITWEKGPLSLKFIEEAINAEGYQGLLQEMIEENTEEFENMIF